MHFEYRGVAVDFVQLSVRLALAVLALPNHSGRIVRLTSNRLHAAFVQNTHSAHRALVVCTVSPIHSVEHLLRDSHVLVRLVGS